MSSLVICICALVVAQQQSASLPDNVRSLANSTDSFADSITKLENEISAVAANAKLVHHVAANKTARALILDDMGRTLKHGMPSKDEYDDAETAALKAAAAYKPLERAAEQAQRKLQHRQAEMGKANLTAAEAAELHSLRTAADNADAEAASAKTDLHAAVEKAERKSSALLEATRAHVRTFEDRVDELDRAARTHEAEAKRAMRAAIAEGRAAADAAYKKRKMSEQAAEKAREATEEWAESQEDAIEDATDRGDDDLERIYGPVKELARHVLVVAERDDAMHQLHARSLLESGKRAELVEVLRGTPSASSGTSWLLWASPAGACAAGAIAWSLGLVSRRRSGLAKPLLG